MPDVVAAHEYAASQRRSGGRAVQPCYGVLVLGIRLFRQLEERLETGEALTVARNPHAWNTAQLQTCLTYQSRQSKPADRGAKPFPIAIAGAAQYQSVGALQLEFDDMMPEAADTMVILAVHVVGNGASDSYQRGTGSDCWKPAIGQRQLDDLAQQYASLAFEHSGDGIETDESIQATRQQQCAAVVQADVTVTAPIAKRQHGRGIRQIVKTVGQCDQPLLVTRPAAPG